jgi:hypothetical protein
VTIEKQVLINVPQLYIQALSTVVVVFLHIQTVQNAL